MKKASKRVNKDQLLMWIVGGVAVVVILAVILALSLNSGGKQPEQTEPPATEDRGNTEPEQTDPTETELATETETEPEETEPVYVAFNPLTGEGLTEASENRPYAVVFNNIKAAQPQYGCGRADILCEILAEGSVTRCLGVFYDIDDVQTFGSIRSARPYFLHLAQSFDAVLVHAGGSKEAYSLLSSTKWDHIDGVRGSGASKYYYRDKDRLNAGYALEHTLFIKSEDVKAYAEKMGCTLTRDGGVSYGWNFIPGSVTEAGTSAGNVTLYFSQNNKKSGKSTAFEYNAEDGLYYASQYGKAYVDAGTGAQLTFRNLLVLNAKTVNQGDSSGHLTITLTGTGTGYYACEGKLIEINWSRKSDKDPFTFTTTDGETLTLSVGKTYMGIIPTKGVVDYQ